MLMKKHKILTVKLFNIFVAKLETLRAQEKAQNIDGRWHFSAGHHTSYTIGLEIIVSGVCKVSSNCVLSIGQNMNKEPTGTSCTRNTTEIDTRACIIVPFLWMRRTEQNADRSTGTDVAHVR